MSHLSTSIDMLDNALMPVLKPKLIADGYYGDIFTALDTVRDNAGKVHAMLVLLYAEHMDSHQSGPMPLCTPICKLASQL